MILLNLILAFLLLQAPVMPGTDASVMPGTDRASETPEQVGGDEIDVGEIIFEHIHIMPAKICSLGFEPILVGQIQAQAFE